MYTLEEHKLILASVQKLLDHCLYLKRCVLCRDGKIILTGFEGGGKNKVKLVFTKFSPDQSSIEYVEIFIGKETRMACIQYDGKSKKVSDSTMFDESGIYLLSGHIEFFYDISELAGEYITDEGRFAEALLIRLNSVPGWTIH